MSVKRKVKARAKYSLDAEFDPRTMLQRLVEATLPDLVAEHIDIPMQRIVDKIYDRIENQVAAIVEQAARKVMPANIASKIDTIVKLRLQSEAMMPAEISARIKECAAAEIGLLRAELQSAIEAPYQPLGYERNLLSVAFRKRKHSARYRPLPKSKRKRR